MKFDRNDTTSVLGVLGVGLLLNIISILFYHFVSLIDNGFTKIRNTVCIVLFVFGMFFIVYAIINIVRINKNNKN